MATSRTIFGIAWAVLVAILMVDDLRAQSVPKEWPVSSVPPEGADTVASQLYYLYYFRDADRLLEILRGPIRSPSMKLASTGSDTKPSPEGPPSLNSGIAPEVLGGAARISPGVPDAGDPADRVTIAVVGNGAVHLNGPIKGIHRIARVIHELDRPVGQVKVGLHAIQFELPVDGDLEQVHDLIDEHLRHASRLAMRAQDLFRKSFIEVAGERQPLGSDISCRSLVLCKEFLHQMDRDHADLSFVSRSLDSLDLLGCLYLTSLMDDQMRDRVLQGFLAKVDDELVGMELERCRGLHDADSKNRWCHGIYRGVCPECERKFDEEMVRRRIQQQLSFPNIVSLLESQRSGNSLNVVQSATLTLLRGVRSLQRAETKLACMRTEQVLLARAGQRGQPMASARPLADDFLFDGWIERQESEAVARREQLRGQIAAVDAELTRMAMAFEDDIHTQFHRRALRDLRRASDHWQVRMGQIESTSILTNDRTPARISPQQTVQFDLPEREILGKEILNGVEALATEGEGIAQRIAVRSAASSALGPAGGILADAVGIRAAGSRLQDLVPAERNFRVDTGNDLEIIPVIQPDGHSIAYRLTYPYQSVVSGPNDSKDESRVVRHFIETEVQSNAYEMREISRFRVEIQARSPSRGVPVLEKLPLAGILFRSRASRVDKVQDTIILADCAIYPSILSVTGADWLHPADAPVFRDQEEPTPDRVRTDRLREMVLTRVRERVDRIFLDADQPVLQAGDRGVEVQPASLVPGTPIPKAPIGWRQIESPH